MTAVADPADAIGKRCGPAARLSDPQTTCFAALHERTLQLTFLWRANPPVLQLLWEQWRARKFAHWPDDSGPAGMASWPAFWEVYAGGALPMPAETSTLEPAFHLFLRIVVCQLCDAFPALGTTVPPPAAAALAAARQDKAWTRMLSGYVAHPKRVRADWTGASLSLPFSFHRYGALNRWPCLGGAAVGTRTGRWYFSLPSRLAFSADAGTTANGVTLGALRNCCAYEGRTGNAYGALGPRRINTTSGAQGVRPPLAACLHQARVDIGRCISHRRLAEHRAPPHEPSRHDGLDRGSIQAHSRRGALAARDREPAATQHHP